MAYDKMVDSASLEAGLTSVADVIRTKGGTSAKLAFPSGFLSAVNALPELKPDPVLQEKTVSPSISEQFVTPDNGYDALSQVTVNAMPTATQATPSISVSSAGLITASATQTAGYVEAGTKSATKQLTVQAAQTVTPGTSDKTIASGTYLTGTQTIKGDANLVAGNIKKGVSIFGVAGSMSTGVTVQTKSGNTSTDSSGKLTISCGFKPDLVMLYFAAGTIEGGTYEATIALPFKDKNTSYQPASSVLQTDYMVMALPMSVTSTGVTITVKRMAYDFSTTAHANTYVSWKAVKYS